jgi:ubiquinone/menaquinone biosynthesis C-methylase UbiE
VLDIGCSSGNFGAELIKRRDCIVDGIEVGLDDVKMAKKKLRRVYLLDIEADDLSFIKEKYDVIYFGDVIEHLIDPQKALKKVKIFLKPKGRIVFSVPNMAHATIRILLLKGDFEYTETGLLDKTHLHFYNLREVERVFNEAGYTIDNIDFVEKDYPNSLINKNLESIGLSASKKFYELMHQPEAAAFQFVGSVVADRPSKTIKRKKFGPIDLFESYYRDTTKGYEDKLARQEEKLLESSNHAKKLQDELDNIFSSKSWLYISRLRKIKRLFFR